MKNLIVILIISSCTSKPNKIVKFEEVVKSIKIEIVDLTWVEEPLTRIQAQPIVEFPIYYVDSFVNLIKENKLDSLEIGIGLVLFKNLDKKSTMHLTERIYSNIDRKTFELWISGYFGNDKLKSDSRFLKQFESK